MISTQKARKQILDNLRESLGEITEDYDITPTRNNTPEPLEDDLKPPELRREMTTDYDDYEEDDEEVYVRPKRRERRMPRRLRTPERKPEKKKRTNNKLMKFNECLRKLKTENPNMSHREAQKNMRQILNQLNANGYEDPETTFMKMTKN
jgi:hypothetical protein